MATTRGKIREQIQIAYGQFLQKNGFNDNLDSRVIDLQVEQRINKLLRVRFENNLKGGDIEIPTCNIITYTLPVSNNSVEIPVHPINLPMDMGIWSVSQSDVNFIPIPKGFGNVYSGTNAKYLEGQTGYTVKGRVIKFTKSVSGNVDVDLLVSDFSVTGESEILPISPDMETEVIEGVLETISIARFGQSALNSIDTRKDDN